MISFTPGSITAFSIFESENALSPTYSTVPGTVISVMEELSNALLPIVFKPSGSTISVKFIPAQILLNAEFPIYFNVLGI